MTQALLTSDREFLSNLLRAGPLGISELCSKEGVTATAIRQRLQRLEGRGLVARRAVRAERGRPHHLYEVTESGRRELGQNYAELATLLWGELQQIEEEPIRRRILGRIQQAMVEQFRDRVTASSPGQRMTQLASVLSERGFEVETEHHSDREGDLPILREHTCPYHEIASHDQSICELEQAVFADVIGSPLELTHCCQRGDRACEFESPRMAIPGVDSAAPAIRV